MTYLDCIILQIIFSILILLGIFSVCYFIYKEFLSYYQDWKTKKCQQKAEKAFEKYLQRVHRRELRKKDKENYPLFFWKDKK